MSARRIALTGPPAAAACELDGFRDHTWADLWCAPIGGDSGERIIRTRLWPSPEQLGDLLVCPLELVLRHLNARPADLLARPDGIAPIDRVELAVEHALRNGIAIEVPPASRAPGDMMLRAALARRPCEPPTESYAETRAVQLLRTWGIEPWRQVPVYRHGRIAFRADLAIPFVRSLRRRRPCPEVIRPEDGVLLEIDSREFHADSFEHDTRRNSTYDELGFHWVGITPNQIEHQPANVHRAIAGALRRAGHAL